MILPFVFFLSIVLAITMLTLSEGKNSLYGAVLLLIGILLLIFSSVCFLGSVDPESKFLFTDTERPKIDTVLQVQESEEGVLFIDTPNYSNKILVLSTVGSITKEQFRRLKPGLPLYKRYYPKFVSTWSFAPEEVEVFLEKPEDFDESLNDSSTADGSSD